MVCPTDERFDDVIVDSDDIMKYHVITDFPIVLPKCCVMTVTYTAHVATSGLGTFLKLLFRWRGSVYKLLWKDFLLFTIMYYALALVYRLLNEEQKKMYEAISRYCEAYSTLIPMAFVLGFYVSIIIARWWQQVELIPWPDRMAIHVSADVHGIDDRSRLMRRTMMRYINLSMVLTLICISPPLKKRFPSWDHLTDAGFMTAQEQIILENIQTSQNKYFVPLVWATSLVSRARKENMITDDYSRQHLIKEITHIRDSLAMLLNYDWICIPLVYTQVVTLSVYTFFMACLMGRQFVRDKGTVDMYVPFFTFGQYFFYMGWLKVAESLCNPFGEDDDDYETNQVVDRHLQISYLIVDDMHSDHPDLIKDQYWDNVDFEIPYTAAAVEYKQQVYLGSTNEVIVEPENADFVSSLTEIPEGEEEDDTRAMEHMENVGRHSLAPMKKQDSSKSMQRGSKLSDVIQRAFGSSGGNVKSNLSLDTGQTSFFFRDRFKRTRSGSRHSVLLSRTSKGIDINKSGEQTTPPDSIDNLVAEQTFNPPMVEIPESRVPDTTTLLVDIPEDRIPDDITGLQLLDNVEVTNSEVDNFETCHSSLADLSTNLDGSGLENGTFNNIPKQELNDVRGYSGEFNESARGSSITSSRASGLVNSDAEANGKQTH